MLKMNVLSLKHKLWIWPCKNLKIFFHWTTHHLKIVNRPLRFWDTFHFLNRFDEIFSMSNFSNIKNQDSRSTIDKFTGKKSFFNWKLAFPCLEYSKPEKPENFSIEKAKLGDHFHVLSLFTTWKSMAAQWYIF